MNRQSDARPPSTAPAREDRVERLVVRAVHSRRGVAVVSLALLLLIFVVGAVTNSSAEVTTIAYAIPVTLVALALGPLPGIAVAVGGSWLYWIAAYLDGTTFSSAHLMYRQGALVFLAVVVGILAARLVASERDAQRLLALAHEGVWTIDLEGRTTYANQRLADLLGTTVDDLLRSPAMRWIGDESVLAERLRRRRLGESDQYEARFLRADGSELWALVSASPLVDSRGHVHGALAMLSDVTDRRRAEQELRASETRLAEAQRVAHIGSWEWEVRTDHVRWSDELFRIFGIGPDDFEPSYSGYLELLPEEDRAAVDAAVRRSLETHEPFEVRHGLVRPDGTTRVIDGVGDVVVEDGEVVRMLGIAHDVTDRVRAEEAYAEASAQIALQRELRARAVELNDAVVQGLALARYLLSGGDRDAAAKALDGTLGRAKELVADLIGDVELEAGALRRERAVRLDEDS